MTVEFHDVLSKLLTVHRETRVLYLDFLTRHYVDVINTGFEHHDNVINAVVQQFRGHESGVQVVDLAAEGVVAAIQIDTHTSPLNAGSSCGSWLLPPPQCGPRKGLGLIYLLKNAVACSIHRDTSLLN